MKKKFHFVFALLLVAFTVNAQNRDLNGDGVVDLSDVTDLIDYILNPPLTQTYTVNGVSFDMITMQGGTFTMGADVLHRSRRTFGKVCKPLPRNIL